jgi:hypothetical protein
MGIIRDDKLEEYFFSQGNEGFAMRMVFIHPFGTDRYNPVPEVQGKGIGSGRVDEGEGRRGLGSGLYNPISLL